eukprot:CAMPEP_0196775022 /NCGR_PEP_ID=MMETSP1104-20130614/3779_1 /TAXON_ID=33652 /ORGANISM="Cafeteria sp., Strain Caron Lab Isolate" /LENGTH=149 /DNA_ID=CAMNT_0042145185 /DNA_START=9 /DNA_END=458 /DNA_ORIENTATION=+
MITINVSQPLQHLQWGERLPVRVLEHGLHYQRAVHDATDHHLVPNEEPLVIMAHELGLDGVAGQWRDCFPETGPHTRVGHPDLQRLSDRPEQTDEVVVTRKVTVLDVGGVAEVHVVIEIIWCGKHGYLGLFVCPPELRLHESPSDIQHK